MSSRRIAKLFVLVAVPLCLAVRADEPVVIWVTGYGPSDTKFIAP
jgi:hypothetical protein